MTNAPFWLESPTDGLWDLLLRDIEHRMVALALRVTRASGAV